MLLLVRRASRGFSLASRRPSPIPRPRLVFGDDPGAVVAGTRTWRNPSMIAAPAPIAQSTPTALATAPAANAPNTCDIPTEIIEYTDISRPRNSSATNDCSMLFATAFVTIMQNPVTSRIG